jgi:hypothetical protein
MTTIIGEGCDAQNARVLASGGKLVNCPKETPWGQAQQRTKIADGIWSASCAGHGGIWISEERRAAMPDVLRDFKTFAGFDWFEEDQDWAVVALAFPEHFNEHVRYTAWRCLFEIEGDNELRLQFLATPFGQAALAAKQSYFEANRLKFTVGASSTSGNGWTVSAHTLDRSKSITFETGKECFDPQEPFTTDDLDRLGYKWSLDRLGYKWRANENTV